MSWPGFVAGMRVWACSTPQDLRKGARSLCEQVEHELGRRVLDGELFLFTNRRRDLCKVLYRDGSGLCLFQKRLEQGRFAPLWRAEGEARVALSHPELMLFLEGCQEVGYRALVAPSRMRKVA